MQGNGGNGSNGGNGGNGNGGTFGPGFEGGNLGGEVGGAGEGPVIGPGYGSIGENYSGGYSPYGQGIYEGDLELPYEEGPRNIREEFEGAEYTQVFNNAEEAQIVYDYLQATWHPNEGGYDADAIFDRITSYRIHYNEYGEVESVEFTWRYEY